MGMARPPRRPWWLLPAALVVVGATAVAVLIAIGGNDGSSPAAHPAASQPKPTTDDMSTMATSKEQSAETVGERSLQSHVPSMFASSCASAQPNPQVTRSTAHLACTDGHLDIDYYLFDDRTSLATYWRQARIWKGGVAGTCRDDENTVLENYYQGDKSQFVGQLLCYHGRQAAHIQWEEPGELIVATAAFSGNNQGMAHGHLVEEWRRDDLGPRRDPAKAVVRHPCGDRDCMSM